MQPECFNAFVSRAKLTVVVVVSFGGLQQILDNVTLRRCVMSRENVGLVLPPFLSFIALFSEFSCRRPPGEVADSERGE